MPEYIIRSSQSIYYEDTIVADSEEQAREIFWDHGAESDGDYGDLDIDEIIESDEDTDEPETDYIRR